MRRDGRPPVSRAGVVLAAFVVLLMVAPAGANAAEIPFRADHVPPGLIVRGEPVTIQVNADATSERGVTAEAFVRGEGAQSFTRLRFNPADESPRVPSAALRGDVLEEYVVVRDIATGQQITIPAAGASAPYRSWIVDQPPVTNLGAHWFGRLAKSEAIVARAKAGDGPGEIGLLQPQEGAPSGPDSFDVSGSGTVWVSDGLHNRLLGWEAGQPEGPPRTIALPFSPLDIALGPDGAIYVMSGAPDHPTNPRRVHAYNPDGTRRWTTLANAGAIFNTQLRFGGDGVLYIADQSFTGWTPITDGAGHPLSAAEQVRGRRAYQPVDDRHVLATGYGPVGDIGVKEIRFGIADGNGTLAEAWGIRATDDLAVQPEPPVLRGDELVAFVGVARDPPGDAFLYEVIAIRLTTDGRVLGQIALNPRLTFGDEHFTHVRVGRDGRLYQMQTSRSAGLRIARFALGGGPDATASPSPAAVSPTATATTSAAAASPSVSSAIPAAIPAPNSSAGAPPAERLLLGAGLLLVAAAGAVLIWRRRLTSAGRPPTDTG